MDNNEEIKLKLKVVQLTQQKQYLRARENASKLVKLVPNDTEAWFALAQLQEVLGEFEQAVKSLYKVFLISSPLYGVAVEKAVNLCRKNDLNRFGVIPAHRLVKLKPNSADAHFSLGLFWFNLANYLVAEESLKRAVELDPNNATYLKYLGLLYKEIAQPDLAVRFLEESQKVSDDKIAYYVSVFTHNYFDEILEDKVFDAHVRVGSLLENQYPDIEYFPVVEHKGFRPLKVGYISADFCKHAVLSFFRPIIEQYSRDRFEVYCYSDVKIHDEITEEIKKQCDYWCDCKMMTDEQLYQQIRSDRIDILVDLTGYAGTVRLDVFARRAAPIQVSYLGYPNTTGLRRMDFRITDALVDPNASTKSRYTECLMRLPGGFLCYTPDTVAPAISALPALSNGGGVCFGSFNHFPKLSLRMFKVWARILRAVSGSKLYVKTFAFQEEAMRNKVWAMLAAEGVGRDRVELSGWVTDKYAHLELYSKVDIHLDSFPYSGTTTTCDALWQGVPTISLYGEVHRSRVSMAVLTQVGLTDFIASNEQEYIDIAIQKASDLKALSDLRSSLREKMMNSNLMNQGRFIAQLEDCYDQMWKSYSQI